MLLIYFTASWLKIKDVYKFKLLRSQRKAVCVDLLYNKYTKLYPEVNLICQNIPSVTPKAILLKGKLYYYYII